MLKKLRDSIAGDIRADFESRQTALEERITELESLLRGVQESLETVLPVSKFIASEDPVELRKRLFTAHRLAEECARSIEGLLQADMLIRRDVSLVADQVRD